MQPPPGFERPVGQGVGSQRGEGDGHTPNAPLTLNDLLSQLQQGFQRVETKIDGVRENIDRDAGKLRQNKERQRKSPQKR